MTTSYVDDNRDIATDAGQLSPVLLHRPSHVADCLDTSLSTVRRLVRQGKLEAVYIGSSLRITDRSIRAIAKSGTRRSRPRGKK
jgi:excisionase family DNA binding protein